ncbi:Gp19/Gp15/Gp42 family protein [Microbacterium sp. NPDC078814]|uniref:Gp19/Gp15/Gp42 family protein n=1 Tax=Microbacterium sp. NPDC078814 TaxID=3154767 RepID=UPI00344D7C34
MTAAWIGGGAPTDTDLIQNWIDRAERLIRRTVKDLQARIDAEAELVPPSTELLATARDVTVAMVIRVFRNPEGTRQVNSTTTTGPFSDTRMQTYGGDVPGGLDLTDKEIAALQGASEGAFSIDLIPPTSPFSAQGGVYPLGWSGLAVW